MNDTTPRCWRNCDSKRPGCLRCPYYDACLLCTGTERKFQRPLGGLPYDDFAEWAADLNMQSAVREESVPEHDRFDLAAFLRFLLGLDDYTLGILGEIIAPTNPERRLSVAELARIHGISRQGMHRKLLHAARRTPELASLLGLAVRKIRRAKRDFSASGRDHGAAAIRQRTS